MNFFFGGFGSQTCELFCFCCASAAFLLLRAINLLVTFHIKKIDSSHHLFFWFLVYSLFDFHTPTSSILLIYIGLFKDKSVAPKERWTDKVPNKIINFFTLIQVVCLGAMFWVKESPIGVLFPIVIALLAPIRFGLEKFGVIKKEYMDVLDED